MKVKELIDVLSKNDPNADIRLELGYGDLYRKACARLALEDDGTPENDGVECLKYMSVSSIEQKQYVAEQSSEVTIFLEQDYYKSEYFHERMHKECEKKA